MNPHVKVKRGRPSPWTSGLTLIELLVVIALLGLMATALLANMNRAKIKAYDKVAQACASEVRTFENVTFTRTDEFKPVTAAILARLNACRTLMTAGGLTEPAPAAPYVSDLDVVGLTGGAVNDRTGGRYAYLVRHPKGRSVYLATESYAGLLGQAPADATNDATLIAGGAGPGPGGGTGGTPSDPSDPNCTVKQVSDVVDSFGRNRLAEYLDTGGQANLSFYHPDTNALLVYYVPNTGSTPVPNAIMIVNADYTMTLVRYRNHPTSGPTTTSVTSPTYIMSPSDIEDLNARLLQADAAHTDASDGPVMSLREAILTDIESRALPCTSLFGS